MVVNQGPALGKSRPGAVVRWRKWTDSISISIVIDNRLRGGGTEVQEPPNGYDSDNQKSKISTRIKISSAPRYESGSGIHRRNLTPQLPDHSGLDHPKESPAVSITDNPAAGMHLVENVDKINSEDAEKVTSSCSNNPPRTTSLSVQYQFDTTKNSKNGTDQAEGTYQC